jgi:hypothetical protein
MAARQSVEIGSQEGKLPTLFDIVDPPVDIGWAKGLSVS